MAFTSGGCRDLRQYMNDPKVLSAFGKLISGRPGYTPVVERRVEQLICKGCGIPLMGEEKFCPECGTKVEKQQEQK
jgi:rubrerythrin